jgi:hypothetical protein
LTTAVAAPGATQERQVIRGAQLVETVTPTVFEGDLRDLSLAAKWAPGDPIKEIPRRHYGRGAGAPEPAAPLSAVDPLLEQQARVPGRSGSITAGISFAGEGFTGVNPPDTVGEIGANYYVQMVNDGDGAFFTFYNKTTGAVVAGPTLLDTLGPGGACADGLGDPVAMYDEMAQRWFLSEFSGAANALCVYISQTSDPISGGWYRYQFTTPNFPDYPKYGVWPDAYYVGTNESGPSALYALERTQMLTGLPADMQRLTVPDLAGFGFQVLQPADLDGPLTPFPGTPGWFMRHNDDEAHSPGSNNPSLDFLQLFAFSVDWAVPANTSVDGPTSIGISEIDSTLCGLFSFSCFQQPGSGTSLDPLREVVMHRLQYRNFGSYQTLVGNLVTDVGSDHGGIRWFELRKTSAGGWTLHQEGTFAPDSADRWMGGISMDANGNIAVGYNIVDQTVASPIFPGLRYTGRLATDPLGTLPEPELTLINGAASNASNRYGDYSSMNVDPVDGCTFWFTGEWNSNSIWSTRIGSFRFTTCSADTIFADGFESSNTSAWSNTVP